MDVFDKFKISFAGASLAVAQSDKEINPALLRRIIKVCFKLVTGEEF